MADNANQIFLPWVQPGVMASAPDEATETLRAGQNAALSLPLKLVVNSSVVAKTLRVYGPGDIIGIDPYQVVRVEPKHRTTDFEPNYFPAIEFDRPDFPWLFTPAKADSQGRLRPWCCLVVVRKQSGVELLHAHHQTLPVLEIKDRAKPGDELPDLSESHLWAHAQVTGAPPNGIGTTLESEPARSVSRLICPRRLHPTTDYVACVVPAFDVGVRAGLNQAPVTDELVPAWGSGAEAPDEITLPVYYFWEFRTGEGGDFEELVRKLKRRQLPEEVGKRPIDISSPGFKIDPPITDPASATLKLEGALRVLGREPAAWPETARVSFQTALAEILNTPWEQATEETGDQEPIVGPPVYGCWQAAAHLVRKTPSTTPPWLEELNLDPRHRAIAAMGTRVIQDQQEPLMAAAWEQLGDIQKINQRMRQAQLSRSVNRKYYNKVFANFSGQVLLRIVAPAQSRVVLEEPSAERPRMLLAQKLAKSAVPSTAVSAPLRKATRPRGTFNQQFTRVGATGIQDMLTLFNKPGASTLLVAPPQKRGAVTIDGVFNALSQVVPVGTPARRTLENFQLSNLSPEVIRSKRRPHLMLQAVVDAAVVHHEHLATVFPSFIATTKLNLIATTELKATILKSLDPSRTVSDAVTNGATLASPNLVTGDELDPIMDTPEFPQPMYEALRDLSQDFLFPGLELVPANTIELLQTNARFIESFMVGLNAEMSRELLWRNYPTDQRGTYFRQFWDTTTAGAKAQFDILPIHHWANNTLGNIAVGAKGDKLVLLIRGDLLRRYPGTAIYAVKAMLHKGKRVPASDHPDEAMAQSIQPPLEVYPTFRGTLEPDVTFIGFELTDNEVVTGHGWFFVLQQQPTEPRFGLDGPPSDSESRTLSTWNDITWADVVPGDQNLEQLSHVLVNKVALQTQNDRGKWGHNSAHMAYITKQLPLRIAIHATELI